ncbi:hypothetical protein J2793_007091 [Paraburkholderia caledonica]|uniref:Uncharacterized protein n=1 Tax=Paraburkholderia caledonica TaxID=134536 RepID=A0AB73INR9_9BURK|nr:hypothetical protein [Paraburkholderia caledonica]
MKSFRSGIYTFLVAAFLTLVTILWLAWSEPRSWPALLGCFAICGYGLYIAFCAAAGTAVRYGAVAIPIETNVGRCFHFISGIAFILIGIGITWR